ncbi:MAG: hypothetical protein EOO37_04095 [Cytophagaceae bacterium]|nr:MAG: hypothetical protein EOO37_04095 [Cytophagaceae bacterium]
MPYYIRVLGVRDPNIHLDNLIKSLKDKDLLPVFGLSEDEQPDSWTWLSVSDRERDEELMVIERNPVVEGELGWEEVEEFKKSTPDFLPASAAAWLNSFFDRVKVIYAFQLLNAVENDSDWKIVSAVQTAIWEQTGGILQADDEGFSNEEAMHILWQFSDNVTGDYSMAVLQRGKWVNFLMQLDDIEQREAFLAGQLPASAQLLE